MSEQHVALAGSERPAASGATRVRDADPAAPVQVTISLKAREPSTGAVASGQTLDKEQFAAAYGARREDADKVAAVLERYGLHIDDEALETGSIRVSGPVAAMNKAFQTDLGVYHSAEQGEFRGRAGELKIPAELEGIVTGVFGLDQRRVARRAAPATVAAPAALTLAQLASHYNFPAGDGSDQKIGIAEFGGGYFPKDLQIFCQRNGLPDVQPHLVSVDLSPLTLAEIQQLPPQQQNVALDETGEVMMDVQIVAALCPAADISLYFTTFDQKGWIDLLDRAIQDLPVTLSISWGLAEDAPDWSSAALTEINKRLAAAAALGITVCVSSGDDGSGDQMPDSNAHVDFPSSSPFVLSVGGTMITGTDGAAVEQTWWQSPGRRTRKGGGATGGGVSSIFPRPQWQPKNTVASVNPGSIDGRIVPDIAALAGPPFYALIFLGQNAPNGGTSASTPLWASLIARINAALPAGKRQRFLAPLLYQRGNNGQPLGQAGCRDISVGQNASHPHPDKGYNAEVGFDAVSGWGVPDGARLLNNL